METETKNEKPRWALAACDAYSKPEHVARLMGPSRTYDDDVTREDLQAIVQQAYDQFGILAEPSLEREAERAPDLIATIRGHVDAAQAQQEANRAGLCPCGATGCSDGVPA